MFNRNEFPCSFVFDWRDYVKWDDGEGGKKWWRREHGDGWETKKMKNERSKEELTAGSRHFNF